MMQKRRRSTTRPSSSVKHKGRHEDGHEDVDTEEDAIHHKAELINDAEEKAIHHEAELISAA